MDGRSFDSLTRSLASGGNRRQVLKGLLGLGGATLAGANLSDADAARRPTPTPKPPTCPGQQTPVNGQCVCQTPKAPGPEKCGPDCCNPAGTGAAHSECCDNACCFGHCYGEELCCPYPREFCEITGECCPEGWTCCPDYGCIAPDQCCTAADCPFRDCFEAICTAEKTCSYGENCLAGGGECCDVALCFRSNCLGDGTCGEPIPDCREGEGQNCCGDLTCNPNNGECCTPLTCDNVAPYTCPSEFSDGCGGFLDCSDVCDDRLSCEGGYCVNLSTTCYADAACETSPLSSCAGDVGFCLKDLNGALVCVEYVYPITPGNEFPECGDCTNNAACVADGGLPGDICLLNAINISCTGCAVGQGDGCGHPIVG